MPCCATPTVRTLLGKIDGTDRTSRRLSKYRKAEMDRNKLAAWKAAPSAPATRCRSGCTSRTRRPSRCSRTITSAAADEAATQDYRSAPVGIDPNMAVPEGLRVMVRMREAGIENWCNGLPRPW